MLVILQNSATKMAATDLIRYDDLCRLCAAKTTLVLSVNIFENEGSLRQLSKKILACLPLQLHESDQLPKMICENCVYKLELFYDFRERCIRTERLLIDLLKEIQQESQQNINILPMDQNDLIMVQQNNHPINVHNLDNVTELNLTQLIKHEIILSDHNVDINGHTLNSIALSQHDLTTQDLSNHRLHTQENVLVGNSNPHNLQSGHYTEDNLDLIREQHHLLSEQFRLQADIGVNISETDTVVSDIELRASENNTLKDHVEVQNSFMLPEERNSLETTHSFEYEHSHPKENAVVTDSKINARIDDLHSHNYDFVVINDIDDDKSNERENLSVVNNALDSKITMDSLPVLNSVDRTENEASKKLCCNICLLDCENETKFNEHYQTHFYKCAVCLAVFTNMETLTSHKKDVHGNDQNKSNESEIVFKIENNNNTGNIRTSSDGENSSSNCDIKEEDTEAENISSSVHKKKTCVPKVCKECGKTYKTNYKLTEHMRKHTGEKPYKCSYCEKAFRSKIGLAQHEAKHTGQYTYSCSTCGKGFQCKSYLMVHQRVHSDLKPYPCTTCGQNFKTKQSLLDHTNRHLGVKPYICDTCGRGFITKGLCEAHQKIHSGLDNRKYSCKLCNKMFVSKNYLQTHIRIHTGEKPYICEVCGKGFLTGVDLRIHSTMHTGEKSFVCETCGKAFARKDALRCHRRSHTGERPYSCNLCGQTFTQFTPMAIHKRLHTGERPYTCETCGKAFISRSTMMSHAKKHR